MFDAYGVLVAIIDMGWRQYLVGVDFEGAHHWTNARQRHWDVERYTRLPELGWNDFRVTSRMVRHARRLVLDRVGEALIARGCPKRGDYAESERLRPKCLRNRTVAHSYTQLA